MTRILPFAALLALAACGQDAATTQAQINTGLKTAASAVVCYRDTAGAVRIGPADAVDQAGIAAGMVLSSQACQDAIAGGTALASAVKK